MSDDLDPEIGSRARGHADQTFGRVIVSSRHNHFVSDGRVTHGAPGEAIFAGELLLASLVSCGLGQVHVRAREQGHPAPQVELVAGFLRNPDDPTRFAELTLDFNFTDVDVTTAEDYVAHFTSKCPIYNTFNRSSPITVRIAKS